MFSVLMVTTFMLSTAAGSGVLTLNLEGVNTLS